MTICVWTVNSETEQTLLMASLGKRTQIRLIPFVSDHNKIVYMPHGILWLLSTECMKGFGMSWSVLVVVWTNHNLLHPFWNGPLVYWWGPSTYFSFPTRAWPFCHHCASAESFRERGFLDDGDGFLRIISLSERASLLHPIFTLYHFHLVWENKKVSSKVKLAGSFSQRAKKYLTLTFHPYREITYFSSASVLWTGFSILMNSFLDVLFQPALFLVIGRRWWEPSFLNIPMSWGYLPQSVRPL